MYPNLKGFSQFGFGQRTCQGVPIVEQDLFLTMGGMVWAFNLRKKCREDGSEIPVHWNDYTPLLIAKPAPFEFDASVRSKIKEITLRQMWETGKGEDDEEEEQNEFLVQTRKEDIADIEATEAVHEDDTASDRGSETSVSGSLARSASSVSMESDSESGDGGSPTLASSFHYRNARR